MISYVLYGRLTIYFHTNKWNNLSFSKHTMHWKVKTLEIKRYLYQSNLMRQVVIGEKKPFLMLLLTYSNLLKKTFGNKLGYDSIGINEKLLIRPLERRHNTVFEIFKHEKTSWYCKCGAESQSGWYLFTCGICDACLEYAERVKHVLIYIRLNVSDTL